MREPNATGRSASAIDLIQRVWKLEFRELFRWHRVSSSLASLLPANTLHRVRTRLLRSLGWQLGHGVIFSATPRLLGHGALLRRLDVGDGVYVNVGTIFELGDRIRIGDHVHIGQNVSVLTTTHEVGGAACRAGSLVRRPVELGAGSWIAAGATIHAGITVGEGAIVAAGCVVTSNVPANSLFGGVPGRVIRMLE